MPGALDLPTGLGKTSVMAIWLLARAAGADLSRRLAYVVDRRAVVDQATDEAERLRSFVEEQPTLKAALGVPDGEELPVSTLRGQRADNRAWLTDPAAPAIIVGTVDMIGSRLLFGGYGISRKMRPYHAGLLGADTLFVLDEAHLVPPFERLLEAVVEAAERGLGPEDATLNLVPAPRLLSLSATGKTGEGAFRLTEEDRSHPVVRKRIHASKPLVLRPSVDKKDLVARIVEEAWSLANGEAPCRVLVFVNARTDAEKIAKELGDRWGRERKKETPRLELFVGARRVFEREAAAARLREYGFLGDENEPEVSAIVVATSAAEVGVDLDADAAVMDLVPWQRMVQRLGRVNRRGNRDAAKVVVIPVNPEKKKEKKKPTRADLEEERRAQRLAACAKLLGLLPALESDVFDGSPDALASLRDERIDLVAAASEPDPLHPPLLRPHLDAWAMTSLADHPGRPEIEPWLRGWVDDAAPEATVVFREVLPARLDHGNWRALDTKDMEAFTEAAGPHALERLEAEAYRVAEWLQVRIKALEKERRGAEQPHSFDGPLVVVVRDGRRGEILWDRRIEGTPRDRLARLVAGATVFVSPFVGGLERGLLSDRANEVKDGPLDLTLHEEGLIPFRVRRLAAREMGSQEEGYEREKELVGEIDDEGEPSAFLVIERREGVQPISEAGRSVARNPQPLEEHQSWVETEARALAERLNLDERLAGALRIAALLHDEGKRAERWQRAFRVSPDDRPLAKSRYAPLRSVLGGYRHELGSLPRLEKNPAFQALDPEMQDLALHLVAAHHGRARPVLPIDDAEEPPTVLRQRAQEVALRFERLSRAYGPWGLAWLESLLRAADQRASALNDKRGNGNG